MLTEVGSDLIILQKNTAKQNLSEEEKAFVSSRKLSTGAMVNNYFQDFSRVVHTKAYNDTDPYGKPAQVFEHEGGVKGIADDLKKMLNSDLSNRLNIDLYTTHAVNNQQKQVFQPSQTTGVSNSPSIGGGKGEAVKYQALEVNISTPVMSLYDLFGFTQEERTQIKPSRGKKKTPSSGKPVQLSLFSSPSKSPQGGDLNPSFIGEQLLKERGPSLGGATLYTHLS